MKSWLQLFLLMLLMTCGTNTQQDNSADASIESDSTVVSDEKAEGKIVYVTEDGNKYHTKDCRYAEGSKAVKLSRAKSAGRKACEVCKPNSDKDQKRCSALTADGTQCKRMTDNASGKCFQHEKK